MSQHSEKWLPVQLDLGDKLATQDSARPEQMELRTFKLTIPIFSNISNFTAGNETDMLPFKGPYQAVELVIIVLVSGSLSLFTVTGNILVILSIIMNRSLQTINNYFLCSLACADLIIGLSSMNLYTVYITVGYWPLGPVVCGIWLILDYVGGGASSLHLLVISFDRYFCITKPLSYPARRTTRIVGMMIATPWILAFFLWGLPILFGKFIIGERNAQEGECYIDFMSNESLSFITSTVTFYLPIAIMSFLYWQISRASRSRVKTGEHKQKKGNSMNSEAGNHISIPCDDKNDTTQHNERSQNGGTGGVGEEELSAPVHPERNEITESPAGNKGNPTVHHLNVTTSKQQPKRKAPPSREKKVTRMIAMIIVAYVVTWTPYNVTVFTSTFCPACVPSLMWNVGYWLCYINSTVNPACYALCNVSFKKTFKQLLFCQHKHIRSGR